MAAYSQANYGIDSYTLSDPKVIVEHYTDGPTYESAWATFAANAPDLNMLPGTCAHFIVDTDGTIHQLVALNLMCRHTVGLNYTAFGIENVGMSDQEILNNARQLSASLALTHWLACKYNISIRNVIGHNESLSSPYHHELIPALATQTHLDWNRADMDIYREKLQALGACA
jgi:N-acetylmuramoyl-L-alanine amidase